MSSSVFFKIILIVKSVLLDRILMLYVRCVLRKSLVKIDTKVFDTMHCWSDLALWVLCYDTKVFDTMHCGCDGALWILCYDAKVCDIIVMTVELHCGCHVALWVSCYNLLLFYLMVHC